MKAFYVAAQEVENVVQNYFKGVYVGDLELLKEQFHPHCLLAGDINGSSYFKAFSEYLEGVANRKSPADSGEPFNMRILGMEFLGTNAIVKAYLPMLGYHYYDTLLVVKLNEKWKIAGKLFAHIAHENNLE